MEESSVKGFLSIGEASRVIGVSASKLRYWESEGLISLDRAGAGKYRKFTFASLAEVADVVMAREIGMPLADLKQMRKIDHYGQRALLDELERGAEEKIAYYENIINIMHKRREAIRTWSRTVSKGVHLSRARLDPVYEFSFRNVDMVQLYLQDPSEAVDIIPLDGSQNYSYGRFMKFAPYEMLRPGDAQEREYLVAPLWMDQATRETNILDVVKKARELGYEPKSCIGQYLFVGGSGEQDDGVYYLFKAWLEI